MTLSVVQGKEDGDLYRVSLRNKTEVGMTRRGSNVIKNGSRYNIQNNSLNNPFLLVYRSPHISVYTFGLIVSDMRV